MFNYQIHSIKTAPEKSKPLLDSLLGLFKNVHGGSFTEAEVQVLLLPNAVTWAYMRELNKSQTQP